MRHRPTTYELLNSMILELIMNNKKIYIYKNNSTLSYISFKNIQIGMFSIYQFD